LVFAKEQTGNASRVNKKHTLCLRMSTATYAYATIHFIHAVLTHDPQEVVRQEHVAPLFEPLAQIDTDVEKLEDWLMPPETPSTTQSFRKFFSSPQESKTIPMTDIFSDFDKDDLDPKTSLDDKLTYALNALEQHYGNLANDEDNPLFQDLEEDE